jgi:hypothetical protein
MGSITELGNIEAFIKSRELLYNCNEKPVKCSNMDSLVKALNVLRVSYLVHEIYITGDTISEENIAGGSADAYMLDIHRPFIYYGIKKSELGITATIISGHNYL